MQKKKIRYYLNQVKMIIIKKQNLLSSGRGCEKKGTIALC
jgi:hypothetical protein